MSGLTALLPRTRKRLLPQWRRRSGWIGVDVNDREIRLAQLAHSDQTLRIEKSLIIPRAVSDTDSVNYLPPGFKELRRQFRGRSAASVLPDSISEFRTFNLPDMETVDARAFLNHELQSADRARVFDCWEILSVKRDDSRQFGVIVTDESTAAQLGADLFATGLNCERIDGRPHALARAAKLMFAARPQETQAVVEFAETCTTFTLAIDGQNIFARQIQQLAMQHVIQTVQSQLALDESVCRLLLREYGIETSSAPGDGELRSALRDITHEFLMQLTEELQRTLEFTRALPGHRAPARIILAGVGATIRGLPSALQREMNLPVRTWTMPAAPGISTQIIPALAVAAALSEPGVPA